MPFSVTPRHDTRLSWPANIPEKLNQSLFDMLARLTDEGLWLSKQHQSQTYQLVQLSLCPTRYNWNHHSQPTRDVQISKMPPMLYHKWCYRVNTLPIPDQHGYQTDDMLHRQNQLQMQIHWERTENENISWMLFWNEEALSLTYCNGINITFMSWERLLALSFPDIPQFGWSITCSGDKCSTMWRQGQRHNVTSMAQKRCTLLASFNIPQAAWHVTRTCYYLWIRKE